ncbi:MAG: heme lyase CcmF/NrfE family subunit [Pseudomonadota bacterium]
MIEFGHFALCIGWLLALVGVLGGAYIGLGIDKGVGVARQAYVEVLRRITIGVAISLGVSLVGLGYGFVTNDYSIQYIWQYSNRAMPWVYKITAIWGGMDGSMLLWCGLVALFCAAVARASVRYPRALLPWLYCFLNSSTLFFTTITLFLTNPFRYLKAPMVMPDGNGLNPLLQNEYMAIHPPTLYLGFTGLAIPYAFCMAALASGHMSNDWIRLTRRWTLIGWTFLTAGIVLGGHWAYLELGWGGFWAWDPVENSSFLPWLTATAFLHSVMVQERKGMLKVWNIFLCVLTYALTVFGTFLTRSGIVQSVHAFASTDIGWVFLTYLAVILLVAAVLVVFRRSELRPERTIESLFSRETVFLLNNLVLLSICFAVLWGVMFPVFSEAFTGQKQTVGIPFFNAVNVPLFLALVFLMGVGPTIAWRRSSIKQMVNSFAIPLAAAFVVAIALVSAGITDFYPVLSYAISFFVVMAILGEVQRGLRSQSATTQSATYAPRTILQLFRRHRVKYGAHIIHFGVALMTVAITASMAHKTEREFTLAPGERFNVGRFSLELSEFHEEQHANYSAIQAHVNARLLKDDSLEAVLVPELRFYPKNKETTTEVALRMGQREDLYLILAGIDESGKKASMKVFINPLQVWLWYGAIVMVVGAVVVAIPVAKVAPVRNTVAAQQVEQSL